MCSHITLHSGLDDGLIHYLPESGSSPGHPSLDEWLNVADPGDRGSRDTKMSCQARKRRRGSLDVCHKVNEHNLEGLCAILFQLYDILGKENHGDAERV